jgi:hypothetical protein
MKFICKGSKDKHVMCIPCELEVKGCVNAPSFCPYSDVYKSNWEIYEIVKENINIVKIN